MALTLICLVAVCVTGAAAARGLGLRGLDALLAAFLAAVTQATAAAWLAGVPIGRLTAPTLAAVHGALTLVALTAAWALRRRHAQPSPGGAEPPPGTGPHLLLLAPMGLLAAAQTAWTVAQAMVFPPYAWDALTYHLPAAALWVQAGRVTLVDWNQVWVNTYPANGELLMAHVLALTSGQSAVQLVQLPFALAAAAATAGMGLALGLGTRSAAFAGLAFYLTPIVLAQSGVPYVDLLFAALYLLAAFFLLRWRQTGRVAHVALAGTAMGLLAGTKTTGVAYAGVAAAVAVVMAGPGRRRDALVALAVPGLAFGAYWYLRTWAAYGNPIYPIAVTFLGRTLFPGEGTLEELVVDLNTPEPYRGHPLFALVHTWLDRTPHLAYDVRTGGFGPLWALLALPSIPYVLLDPPPGRRREVGMLAALLGLAFLVQPMRWWTRYTLAVLPLGLLAVARVMEARDSLLRRTVAAVATVLVLVGGLAGTLRHPKLGLEAFRKALDLPPGEQRITRLGVFYEDEYAWIDALAPTPVTIAFVPRDPEAPPPGPYVAFPYVLLGDRLQNRIEFLRRPVDLRTTRARYAMVPRGSRYARLLASDPAWERFFSRHVWEVYRRR